MKLPAGSFDGTHIALMRRVLDGVCAPYDAGDAAPRNGVADAIIAAGSAEQLEPDRIKKIRDWRVGIALLVKS